MADYKELLRRAVEALPENNGSARRAVYEKARAALVGQLRAINPPLAARDITAHRLQLEDCIRQVEQEASEAVIAGLGGGRDDSPPPPPVYFETPVKKAAPAPARPVAKPATTNGKEPPKPLPPGGTIEEIIAAANAETESGSDRSRAIVRPDAKPMGKPVPKLVPSPSRQQAQIAATRQAEPSDDEDEAPAAPQPVRTPSGAKPVTGRPLPSIVARAEAAKSRTGSAQFGAPIAGAARGPVLEPRRELAPPRFESGRNGQAAARQVEDEPVALFNAPPVAAAMSAVREVELEAPADPQGAIDRAIATLDREARADEEYENSNGVDYAANDDDGDDDHRNNGFAPSVAAEAPSPVRAREGKAAKASAFAKDAREPRKREPEPRYARSRDESERRGLGAVTIFLIVFAVLLVGAGGAGIWAWREGFIDLDAMFGRGPVTEQAAVAQPAITAATDTPATGPGNTDTPAEAAAPTAELAVNDDRLGAEPAQPQSALPLVDPSSEARLGAEPAAAAAADAAAEQAVASVDPASLAGSQSLLLEASDNGTTGAVPFSGTVEWSKGTDEMGLPTLIGAASIPARNLSVDILIRKNSDASLPASHLMEVNFRVNDSFIGGSIAGLPGVLLKNEELVQGTPLVGASARVVGNSFLFALSAAPADITANSTLLTSRKWMDLALIYATGKRAIITLEKDATAEAMFNEVVAAWNAAPAPTNG